MVVSLAGALRRLSTTCNTSARKSGMAALQALSASQSPIRRCNAASPSREKYSGSLMPVGATPSSTALRTLRGF